MTSALSHIEEAERIASCVGRVEGVECLRPSDPHEHAFGCPARLVDVIAQALADRDEKLAQAGVRIEALEARISRLSRCLLPVWMGMAEFELCGDPMPDAAVVLSFMGSGASDQVTAGEVRAALNQDGETK